jgi:predicted  nucleic acid-binding Zn-ribbon protein
MPYQCVHCKRIIETSSRELIEGCNNCKGHFFFYVRDDQLERVKENPIEIPMEEKKQVEKDIREIAGIETPETPVILDLESVRATGAGKFEIDVVNLFRKGRPLIYKMEEGKYIIDLSSTMTKSPGNIKEIRDPRGN